MSCSGGEASLIADLAENTTLAFTEIAPRQYAKLFDALGERVKLSNPLDYHTYIWGQEEAMTAAFSAMFGGDYAATLLILDYPNPQRCESHDWWTSARAFARAAEAMHGAAVIVATMPENIDKTTAEQLIDSGIVPMLGMRQALLALQAAYFIGLAQRRAEHGELVAPLVDASLRPGKAKNIDEYCASQLLAAAGVRVPEQALISSADQAVAAAERIGYPVALKIVSEHIVHKSDVGGVALNLGDSASVQSAAQSLLQRAPQAMVVAMVKDAVAEVLVGICRDSLLGPYLVLGLGGVMVELIRDQQILLLPVTKDAICQALQRLKLASLLQGYRGRPAADTEAIVATVFQLVKWLEQNRDRVVELEINPLLVKAVGKGAYLADAYMNLVAD